MRKLIMNKRPRMSIEKRSLRIAVAIGAAWIFANLIPYLFELLCIGG